MQLLAVASLIAAAAAIALVSFWAGTRVARGNTAQLAGAAQRFCLEQCRLPDSSCPLIRAGMRREDCPLWRMVGAAAPTNVPVDHAAPLGAGPYRNPGGAAERPDSR